MKENLANKIRIFSKFLFTKGWLILIPAVAIFIVLPFTFRPSKLSQIEALPAASNEKIIYVDEKGFAPKELTIVAGDTVTFINRGREGHWPASNIHPTHQIYPEFDPKKSILPNENWSFQFNKAGEWKFHDHVYPNFTGKITVAENANQPLVEDISKKEKQPIPMSPKDIKNKLAAIDMLAAAKNPTELAKWMQIAGPKELMEDLLLDSGNGALVDCHQQAHYIGRLAYELYGAEVLKFGNALCHSGYYHGAIEEFLKEEGTTDLAKKTKAVCDLFDTLFGRFECLHGIGHGLLAYEDYDLPGTLKLCGGLPTQYEQSSCYGGVFMENIVTAQGLGASTAHATKWANKTDPHFPCNSLDSDSTVLGQCYLMQTSWMLTIFNYNFDPVIAECPKAPSAMVSTCFRSLGRDAAGNSLRDASKILAICGKISDNRSYNDCLIGALNVIVDFWGDALESQATELCKAAPAKGKSQCYNTLFNRLHDIFTEEEKRQAVCDGFEPDYHFICED